MPLGRFYFSLCKSFAHLAYLVSLCIRVGVKSSIFFFSLLLLLLFVCFRLILVCVWSDRSVSQSVKRQQLTKKKHFGNFRVLITYCNHYIVDVSCKQKPIHLICPIIISIQSFIFVNFAGELFVYAFFFLLFRLKIRVQLSTSIVGEKNTERYINFFLFACLRFAVDNFRVQVKYKTQRSKSDVSFFNGQNKWQNIQCK